MTILARILFPVSFAASVAASAFGPAADTVTYIPNEYKLHHSGNLDAIRVVDTTGFDDSLLFSQDSVQADSIAPLTARDTIFPPDSLRETDPFRYKYYVAIVDSLTHREVSDSLQHSGDSLMAAFKMAADTSALADSLHAESDWADKHLLDSLYTSDSTARARAVFLEWYNSLDKDARKKYDKEQTELKKMAVRDSLDAIKEEKKALRDSIVKNTPRILETPFLPDTMQYKRMIAWTVDRDFQDLRTEIPDTSFNYHFYDYAFQRKDVNATWLGVAGGPVQYYDWFKRKSITGVEFWEPQESWTFSPETVRQYNCKTPNTEFGYWGTILGKRSKESDNVHILTTQNITPATNFSILYDRWGGGGMLNNEEVKNKTFAAAVNHLGKRYLANAGVIVNNVERGENGGMEDTFWVRDTTVDAREIPVLAASGASTKMKKTTFFGDQQLRIPLNFRDSTKSTSGYIGHSIEFSKFTRSFTHQETDSLGQTRLDNKLYLRLQPWSDESLLSKLDIGVGDYLNKYHKALENNESGRDTENSVYVYAGVKGQLDKYMYWNADAHQVFAGADAGNTDLSADLQLNFYPFRKAKTSPMTFGAGAEFSSLRPTYYQRRMFCYNDPAMQWETDFYRTSTLKLKAYTRIPHWKMDAEVGYAVLDGNLYYDKNAIIRQHNGAMSILSADIRKHFSLFGFLHLDNRLLAQVSSDQEAVPLPALAANLRYYAEFPIAKGAMTMQMGVNALCNTEWYSPAWNMVTGTFYNQQSEKYTNGPYFDLFINMQWKQVCIFIKLQNAGKGWPLDRPDFFCADRYMLTESGMSGLKIGVWWPFYTSHIENRKVSSQ